MTHASPGADIPPAATVEPAATAAPDRLTTPVTRSGLVLAVVLEAFLWLAVAVTAVVGVARPLLGPNGLGWFYRGPFADVVPTVPATLTARALATATAPDLPAFPPDDPTTPGTGLEIGWDGHATVTIWDPDLRQWAAVTGTEVVRGVVTLAVLVLLVLAVRSLRRGRLFERANLVRVYLIAGLVGVGGTLAQVAAAWGRVGVLHAPAVREYVSGGFTVSFVPLWAGLAIAVGAEVVRQGARMRADVEGLV